MVLSNKIGRGFTLFVIIFVFFSLISNFMGWSALATVQKIGRICNTETGTCMKTVEFNRFGDKFNVDERMDFKVGEVIKITTKCSFNGCNSEMNFYKR